MVELQNFLNAPRIKDRATLKTPQTTQYRARCAGESEPVLPEKILDATRLTYLIEDKVSMHSFYCATQICIARTSYGNVAGWVSVCHSRYCIKTTKPILKVFRPSGSPII